MLWYTARLWPPWCILGTFGLLWFGVAIRPMRGFLTGRCLRGKYLDSIFCFPLAIPLPPSVKPDETRDSDFLNVQHKVQKQTTYQTWREFPFAACLLQLNFSSFVCHIVLDSMDAYLRYVWSAKTKNPPPAIIINKNIILFN